MYVNKVEHGYSTIMISKYVSHFPASVATSFVASSMASMLDNIGEPMINNVADSTLLFIHE